MSPSIDRKAIDGISRLKVKVMLLSSAHCLMSWCSTCVVEGMWDRNEEMADIMQKFIDFLESPYPKCMNSRK
jgi:hypothetical protein